MRAGGSHPVLFNLLPATAVRNIRLHQGEDFCSTSFQGRLAHPMLNTTAPQDLDYKLTPSFFLSGSTCAQRADNPPESTHHSHFKTNENTNVHSCPRRLSFTKVPVIQRERGQRSNLGQIFIHVHFKKCKLRPRRNCFII